MNATSVALPKTYHQRASCGTRCFKLGPINAEIPSRSSSQRHPPMISRFITEVTQTSKSAVSRVSKPARIDHACRFGNRQYSRLRNLRYDNELPQSVS